MTEEAESNFKVSQLLGGSETGLCTQLVSLDDDISQLRYGTGIEMDLSQAYYY